MEKLNTLQWRGINLSEHPIMVPVMSGSLEEWLEHDGELIEINKTDEQGQSLNASWVWDDTDKKTVAAVFDSSYWKPNDAKRWVAEALRLSEKGEATSTEETEKKTSMDMAFAFLAQLFSLQSPPQAPIAATGGQPHDQSTSEESEAASGNGTEAAEAEHGSSPEAFFSFAEAAVTNAAAPYIDKETGYIWKCIWRAGRARHYLQDGSIKFTDVTPEMIDAVYQSFGHAVDYVDIPNGHHLDDPTKNTGRVERVEKRNNGTELWGLLNFTEPTIKEKFLRKTIPDVSVAVMKNVADRRRDNVVHPWALWHVALTTKPLMSGLGFSHEETPIESYTMEQPEEAGEPKMPDLTKEELAEAMKLQFGFTPDEYQAARTQLEAQNGQLTQFAASNRTRRIREVVQALEGKIDVEGITRLEGYRHDPAVVKAVEKILKDQPEVIQMSVNFDGTCPNLDNVVLELVNSIPETSRVKLESFSHGSFSTHSHNSNHRDDVSDEDIDNFLKEVA